MKKIFLAVCLSLSSVVCAAQAKTDEAKNEELFLCVKSGDAGCVARALGSGANANAVNKEGVRVLSMAAEGQSTSIVQLLFASGAEVNTREGVGIPLCRAALFGRKEIVETLLDHGAKANVVCDGDHGDSALMDALRGASLRSLPDDLTEESAETGNSDEDKKSSEANTWREIPKASAADFLAIARLLIARGADVNVVASCDAGETALMYAAMGANVEMVKELLSHGADVKKGGSVFEMLQEFEREFGKANRLGLPALSKEQSAMFAWDEKTRAAREEIRQLLKAAGAKEAEEAERDENEDAQSNEEALVEAADEAFTSTIKKNDVEDLERLIKAYAGHPLGAGALSEALRTAVIYNRREMFKLLIARGADPNGGRFKILIQAVNQVDAEYVRMLLEAGADVNATEDDGRTALDIAEGWSSSSEDHQAVIELLKAHGAQSKREK